MKKPKIIKVINHFIMSDIFEYINNKYKIDIYDYEPIDDIFLYYQRTMNDPVPFDGCCPDLSGKMLGFETEMTIYRNGNRVESTKEQYDADFKLIHEHWQRYAKWTHEVDKDEVVTKNYHNWLYDNHIEGLEFQDYVYINLDGIIKSKDTPKWAKKITRYIRREFGKDVDGNRNLVMKFK